LATRRDRFLAVGGFDEGELAVSYSDIDFALRLRAAGKKILWSPRITLYHHESKTRGLDHLEAEKTARNAAEQAIMQSRWGAALRRDPSVNPVWYPASLPFRLIAPPSDQRLRQHIRDCASRQPWLAAISEPVEC
jgi:GT2 family glycosyltransferase